MGKGIEACAPMNFGTHFRGENPKNANFHGGFPNPCFRGSVRKASRTQYCMHPNTARGIETSRAVQLAPHVCFIACTLILLAVSEGASESCTKKEVHRLI